MLISKPYQCNDVLGFKLVTGEEIIAKLVSETDEYYELSKPLTLIPTPQGMAMSQSLISADLKNNNIRLNKSTVVMHSPVRSDINSEYIRGTTGIQPVSAGTLTV